MKTLIKKIVVHWYINIYERYVRVWVNNARVKKIESSLKYAGSPVTLKLPFWIHNPQHISIGRNFSAEEGLKLEAIDSYLGQKFTPAITIGDNVKIISGCHIGAVSNVTIGNGVLIASNVFITDHFHGDGPTPQSPEERPLLSKGDVIIGENVWIGQNVVILPGVKIGNNAVIGANAVVTKSVMPFATVAGNPAKPIKARN